MTQKPEAELLPCREAFETWMKGHGIDLAQGKDAWDRTQYIHPHVETAWGAYQEAWHTRTPTPAPFNAGALAALEILCSKVAGYQNAKDIVRAALTNTGAGDVVGWLHECEHGKTVCETKKEAQKKQQRWQGTVTPLVRKNTPTVNDADRAEALVDLEHVDIMWRTTKYKAVLKEKSIATIKKALSAPQAENLTAPLPKGDKIGCEFVNAKPDGTFDNCTFGDVDEALNKAGAPLFINGKWLSLPERIAALAPVKNSGGE